MWKERKKARNQKVVDLIERKMLRGDLTSINNTCRDINIVISLQHQHQY